MAANGSPDESDMKNKTEVKKPDIKFINAESGVDFHWWQKNATPLHSHTYYEIVVIYEGPVTQFCNDVKYTMVKGDIFLLKPGDVHIFLASQTSSQLNFSIVKSKFKKICDNIEPSLFDKINEKSPILAKASNAEFNFIVECADRIKIGDSEQKKQRNDIIIKQIVSNVVCFIYNFLENENQNKNELPLWLSNYLNSLAMPENIGKRISELYGIAPYSQPMLSVYFKKYLNTTLVAYMQRLRLDYATNLLIHSNYPISLIANKISYTTGHFIHEFSSLYGMSPAEYRNKLNKNR